MAHSDWDGAMEVLNDLGLRYVLGEEYDIIKEKLKSEGKSDAEISAALTSHAKAKLPATPEIAKQRIKNARRNAVPRWRKVANAILVIVILAMAIALLIN